MNSIIKICPLCSKEILADDKIKICNLCNTPHHLNCWESNNGCAVKYCSSKNEQDNNKKDYHEICRRCGSPLSKEQEFCTKCGAQKITMQNYICKKCGQQLSDEQDFCPKCGQKTGISFDKWKDSTSTSIYKNTAIAKEKFKSFSFKKVIPIIFALILVIVGISFIPKIFVPVETLCVQGNYQKAYKKAHKNEKEQILIESITAEISQDCVDSLKNPSSFSLREAYYYNFDNSDNELAHSIVLYVNASNSYGGTVGNYWVYNLDTTSHEWEYFTSVSDLVNDEYSDYDDDDEFYEKLIDNLGRGRIRNALKDGVKLSKEGVKRINDIFKADSLDTINPVENPELFLSPQGNA